MTKPEITLPIPQSVLAICTAYESGFGDGINGLIKRCPYSESSDAAHAWRYGVVEGNKKRAAEPGAEPDLALDRTGPFCNEHLTDVRAWCVECVLTTNERRALQPGAYR